MEMNIGKKTSPYNAVCVIFLLTLKWPKNKNIYEVALLLRQAPILACQSTVALVLTLSCWTPFRWLRKLDLEPMHSLFSVSPVLWTKLCYATTNRPVCNLAFLSKLQLSERIWVTFTKYGSFHG